MAKKTSEPKKLAAHALYPVLETFHLVDGQSLRAVWRVYKYGLLTKIILDFEQQSLVIRANPDDDSVEFCAQRIREAKRSCRSFCANNDAYWKQWIGSEFGWGWIIMNQQGCCDGVILSFGTIQPQLLLIVEASSIKEMFINPCPSPILKKTVRRKRFIR